MGYGEIALSEVWLVAGAFLFWGALGGDGTMETLLRPEKGETTTQARAQNRSFRRFPQKTPSFNSTSSHPHLHHLSAIRTRIAHTEICRNYDSYIPSMTIPSYKQHAKSSTPAISGRRIRQIY
jgi:hypothetical protein